MRQGAGGRLQAELGAAPRLRCRQWVEGKTRLQQCRQWWQARLGANDGLLARQGACRVLCVREGCGAGCRLTER